MNIINSFARNGRLAFLPLAGLIFFAGFCFEGCVSSPNQPQTLGGLLSAQPQPVYSLVTNLVWQTNVVSLTSGATQTNVIQQAAVAGVWQTNFTYTPNPAVAGALNAAAQITAPAPWGWIVGGITSLIAAGLGLVAKAKSGQLSTSQQIVRSVVAGVEAAGNDQTKQSIATIASASGIQHLLDPIVQAVSKQMPALTPTTASQSPAPTANAPKS
jgi:hypothetical protein